MSSDLSTKLLLLSYDNSSRAGWCFITQKLILWFEPLLDLGEWERKKQMMFRASNCLFPNEQAELMKQFSLKRTFWAFQNLTGLCRAGICRIIVVEWKQVEVQIGFGYSKTPCRPERLHLGCFASNISYQLF